MAANFSGELLARNISAELWRLDTDPVARATAECAATLAKLQTWHAILSLVGGIVAILCFLGLAFFKKPALERKIPYLRMTFEDLFLLVGITAACAAVLINPFMFGITPEA